MADDRRDRRNDQLLRQTLPGWAVLAVILFIVVTRDTVSVEVIGTLVGFDLVLFGVPFASWRSQLRRDDRKEDIEP